jgi:hypothetical protein
MIFLRNVIIVLLLAALAVISVVGIKVEAPQIWNFTPDRINAIGRSVLTVMRPGYQLFLSWVVILLGVLLTLFLTVARPRRRMKIEVQMGGGRVVIMDAAIKKYIKNALAEIGEITVKKIDLREQRNLVTTDITADVRTRENLPTLERRVISRVRAALAEDLGITNLGDVHVYIRNFEVTGRPITPAPAPAKQPEIKPGKQAKSDIASESPVVEPISTTAAAATASSLAEPIEPEGAAEPIIIPGEEAGEVVFTDSGLMTTEPAAAGASSTETSSEIIAEKPLPAQGEELTARHEDEDEPLPWGLDKKDSDEDKDLHRF